MAPAAVVHKGYDLKMFDHTHSRGETSDVLMIRMKPLQFDMGRQCFHIARSGANNTGISL